MDCTEFINMPYWFVPMIMILAIWTLFWKGLSTWHAARRKEGVWFVILLIFNTLGILDIIYLFGFAKIKTDNLFK